MLLKLCLAACIAIGVNADPVKCKEIGTQYAVKGCSTEYYQCHNGKLSTMQCPSNLFFDINGLNCDYRDRVQNCVLGNAELQYGSDDLPSCETQSDGTLLPIELTCTNKFAICDHGRAIQRQCPYELYYNSLTQRCDQKRNVEGCQPLSSKKTTDNKQTGNAKFKIPRQPRGSYGLPEHETHSQHSFHAPVAPSAVPIPKTHVSSQNKGSIQKPAADHSASAHPDTIASDKKKFDCTNRKDGIYPAANEKCAPFFWSCAHQEAYKYNCPKGLFFDNLLSVCAYRYEIPECGGTRPAPTETPAPARDVPKVNFNCTGKETGYYPMGKCVTDFVQCLEGTATLIKCPAETVFDGNTTTCVFKSNCGVSVQSPKPVRPHDSSSAHQAPVANVPADHIRGIPPVPKVHYDCSNKKDGLYAIVNCKKEYVVCNAGIASIMFCHGDLVFNQATESCDYSESCLNFKPDEPRADVPVYGNCPEGQYFDSNKNACYSRSSVVPAPVINKHAAHSNHITPAASHSKTIHLSPASVPAPKPAPVPVNCNKLENGAHPHGKCSPNYILCWEESGVAGLCTSSLVFNPKTKYCDHKSNVEDCPEYVAPKADAAPSIALNHVADAPSQFTPPNFSCKGKTDGIYGIGGCTQEFVQCYAEILTSSKCISNLYYNEGNGMCDYKENVEACGGKSHSPASKHVPKQDSVVSHAPSHTRVQSEASPVVHAFSCSKKEDGFYSKGCSSIYFACSQGTTMQNNCPASLKFSQDSQHCDFDHAVPECGGKLPIAVPEKKLTPLADPAPRDNSACKGKSDGIFSTGACSATYLSCVSGSAFVQQCAGNLIFNEKNGACDHETNVEGCQSAHAPIQVEHAAPSSGAVAHQQTQPVTQSQTSRTESFCSNKDNGIYSNGCSRKYFVCSDKVTYPFHCEGGNVFDEVRSRCLHPSEAQECVISPSQTAHQAPSQVQQQFPPVQHAQSQVPPQTQPAPQHQQAPSQMHPEYSAYYTNPQQHYVPVQQDQPAQQYQQYQFPVDQPSYDQYGYGY